MRWFWIDRYTEFVSGRHAAAVKNVTLAEDYLHDHFPCSPQMPNSLILEGLAQTGGLLVGEHNAFTKRVVLAKVSSVKFHFAALPGDTLVYRTIIKDISARGAMISATSHIDGRLQGEAEIFFAHLDERTGARPLFKPAEFMNWLRIVRLFDVGRTPEGQPIKVPEELAQAEIVGSNCW